MKVTEAARKDTGSQLPAQLYIWMISGFNPNVWGGGGEEAVNATAREFAANDIRISSFRQLI